MTTGDVGITAAEAVLCASDPPRAVTERIIPPSEPHYSGAIMDMRALDDSVGAAPFASKGAVCSRDTVRIPMGTPLLALSAHCCCRALRPLYRLISRSWIFGDFNLRQDAVIASGRARLSRC
jgi:hypothetical protein